MIRIVHLSDLHFGTVRAHLLQPLVAAVRALCPDLIVVSGDLTQRARVGQFRAAAAFVNGLAAPVLVVPGNHDVPLYNPFVRFTAPFRRYAQAVTADLAPIWAKGGVVVAGMNTVDPLSHQKGIYRPAALTQVEQVFSAHPQAKLRIVVAHHPPQHDDGVDKHLPRFAAEGITRLAAAGADIILAGHLHRWRASPLAEVKGVRGMLQVQAGTALSGRVRGEANDFNLVEQMADGVAVTRFVAGDDHIFRARGESRFAPGRSGWGIVDVSLAARPVLRSVT